jgi:hypothetical protein
MSHPVGEHLVCDSCGAEIVFVKPCPCKERKPKAHSDMCCNKEMRSLGVPKVDASKELTTEVHSS